MLDADTCDTFFASPSLPSWTLVTTGIPQAYPRHLESESLRESYVGETPDAVEVVRVG